MRKRIVNKLIGGGKMNSDKLKGKLREKKKTYKDCANYLGIGESQFCKKINKEVDFWLVEAAKLAVYLELSTEEFCAIFMNV